MLIYTQSNSQNALFATAVLLASISLGGHVKGSQIDIR